MNQFLKFLLASCLGVILAIGSIVAILFIIGISASSSNKAEKAKPNSILEIKLEKPIPDLTNNLERDPFALEQEDVIGLHDILMTLEHAKSDKNIKGILLKPSTTSRGMATAARLREGLEDFKESGKFVIAQSEWYSQGDYFMATTADQIYLHPMGSVDLRGFAAVIPFFKDMLDKVGVQFQAFYAGDFKSATEPYRRNDMSEENRLQLREFLDEMYADYMQKMGNSLEVSTALLDSVAEKVLIKNAEMALDMGLVDKLAYEDEIKADLRERLGLEADEKIPMINLYKYYESVKKDANLDVKDKIAVIYAEGEIVDGEGESGQVGSETYREIIEKLRKDDKVKSIVLRVNSPGGSGLASENIWRELKLCRDEGKKVVVSMGDYAASGGYYISCAADSVLAEPETLTGSIGVFNLFPDVTALMNDKLGIHFDTVKTGQYSAGFNPTLGLSEGEQGFLQSFIDQMYERFLQRVSDARGMTRDEAHAVAQGRIWSGRKALTLGLVDRLGDLDDAVASAASLANLEKYRIVTYPKPKDPLQKLLEELTGQKMRSSAMSTRFLEQELGTYGKYVKYFKQLKTMEGPQYRLPFLIEIK